MTRDHDLIVRARDEHRVLRIAYRGAGKRGSPERDIEVYEFDGRYIDAYCRRAQERRTFRVDRIVSLELLDARFVTNLLVADELDQSGWANKSAKWRRKRAGTIGDASENTAAPVAALPAQAAAASRTSPQPGNSSGILAKVAAGIVLAIIGLSALLQAGGSSLNLGSYASPSASSLPAWSTSPSHSSESSGHRWGSSGSSEASSLLQVPGLGSARRPLVAENGSVYGELNENGVPKTVQVNGYYRQDGTYVRGYYRSSPYSNPLSGKSPSSPSYGSTSQFHAPKMPAPYSSPTFGSSTGSHRGR